MPKLLNLLKKQKKTKIMEEDKQKKEVNNINSELLKKFPMPSVIEAMERVQDLIVRSQPKPSVLFQDEINAFLKELFYEDWMDDNDWLMFLEELEAQSGISVQSLSNDLQVGLKNGHSIEKQFELIRVVIKKRYDR